MSFMSWQESFSVGVRHFDEQHQKIIDLINLVEEGIRQQKDEKFIGATLIELVAYTKTHFVDEERMMKLHEYPDFEKHKLFHEYFVKRVKRFAESFVQGNSHVAHDLLAFLKIWLLDHISQTDKEYGSFLNQKGIK